MMPEPRRQPSFLTTRWTQVRQASKDTHAGRMALADLCDGYYEPVVAFLRCELRDADLAREMSHAFFAEMLEGGTIATADREQGRFRSYLLGAVKHFVSRQSQAAHRLKRGGGVVPISLDENASVAHAIPDVQRRSPDEAFDLQWALTTVARALAAVRNECAADGRMEFFDHVKPWLTGDAAHGDQAEIANACGMTLGGLKMAIHRLKRRFRDYLMAEIAGTLDDRAMVDVEMRVLFSTLAS